MVLTNNSPGTPSIARLDAWKSAAVSFGAPLGPRTGVSVSGSLADMRKHERSLHRLSTATVGSFFAHVIRDPSDRTQVRVMVGAQNVRRAYGDVPEFRDAGIEARDRLFQSQATWEFQQTRGGRLTIAEGI